MSAWRTATVTSILEETSRAKTFRLRFPEPLLFRPGQHLVIRLTAPDGYTASRSYSIASAPDVDRPDEVEVTVELLDGGEVSGFLHDGVVVGDELEVRGPIGGWFVWDGETPAMLLGGGSGAVPLMSMLRAARAAGTSHLLHLLVSVRTHDDLLYADEMVGPEVLVAYTRSAPPGATRPAGRLTTADLLAAMPRDVTAAPLAYVCGSAAFANAATLLLEDIGHPADHIRVERFGPSAG